ncbi:MAG: hypothetical protein HOP19_27850 [Acidobacteria bacterium]|nr:hypothetical protein [Acidobacteriota bacterium]
MNKHLMTLVCACALVLALSIGAAAQDKKPAQDAAVTLTGNILDVNCSASAKTPDAAANHKKGCSLSPRCIGSGLGVYADGKFVAFDEAGSAKGKTALEATAKANGAKFKVVGKMTGEKLMVESITEIE